MKRFIKMAGVITLEIIIIAFLIGLAVATLWLFNKGRSSDWNTWTWFSVITEGLVTLIGIPVGIYMSILSAKERINRIKREYTHDKH